MKESWKEQMEERWKDWNEIKMEEVDEKRWKKWMKER